jgi:ferrous iron transport protein A
MGKDNAMILKDGKNGGKYIVEKSTIEQPVKRRLEALGLIEGTMIRKINEALDGSIILMVRGTRLAIGKELAEVITVREATAKDVGHGKRGCGMGLRGGRGKGCGMGMRRGVGGAEKRGDDNCWQVTKIKTKK